MAVRKDSAFLLWPAKSCAACTLQVEALRAQSAQIDEEPGAEGAEAAPDAEGSSPGHPSARDDKEPAHADPGHNEAGAAAAAAGGAGAAAGLSADQLRQQAGASSPSDGDERFAQAPSALRRLSSSATSASTPVWRNVL